MELPPLTPMPVTPTLHVQDLSASVQWYRDALGFQHMYSVPRPDGSPQLAHLLWAAHIDLILKQETPRSLPAPKGVGIDLSFPVGQGVSGLLAERARRHGVHVLEDQTQASTSRRLTVIDPDGYRLTFAEAPPPAPKPTSPAARSKGAMRKGKRLRGVWSSLRSLALATLLLFSAVQLAAAQPAPMRLDTSSNITYTGFHPTHDWSGTSRTVGGTVWLDTDDPTQSRVDLIVPVISFDSGRSRRDQNMRELLDASRYPNVRFVSDSITVEVAQAERSSYEGTWRVHGQLTFHGRTLPATLPAQVRVEEGRVDVRSTFRVPLEAYEVKRPRLLFVPIEDEIELEASLQGTLEAPAERTDL